MSLWLLKELLSHQLLQTWYFMLYHAAAAAARLLQSCPTLCDPIDSSPLGCIIEIPINLISMVFLSITAGEEISKSGMLSWGRRCSLLKF